MKANNNCIPRNSLLRKIASNINSGALNLISVRRSKIRPDLEKQLSLNCHFFPIVVTKITSAT
jgi:hypothetical protein